MIAVSLILIALAIYVLIGSLILMAALKKEQEARFLHWLRAMGIFIAWRTISILFQSIANVILTKKILRQLFTYYSFFFFLFFPLGSVFQLSSSNVSNLVVINNS